MKPATAHKQLDLKTATRNAGAGGGSGASDGGAGGDGSRTGGGAGGTAGGVLGGAQGGEQSGGIAPDRRVLQRFHGTVALDAARAGRDAGKIAEELLAHISGQLGAEVTVALEIEVHLPRSASEQIVRVVSDNARTLTFTSQGFEEE